MTRPKALDDPTRTRRSLACTGCRNSKAKCDGAPPKELPTGPTPVVNRNTATAPSKENTRFPHIKSEEDEVGFGVGGGGHSQFLSTSTTSNRRSGVGSTSGSGSELEENDLDHTSEDEGETLNNNNNKEKQVCSSLDATSSSSSPLRQKTHPNLRDRASRPHNPTDIRIATSGNGRPCTRCVKLGETCSWLPSRRKGRPRRLPKDGQNQSHQKGSYDTTTARVTEELMDGPHDGLQVPKLEDQSSPFPPQQPFQFQTSPYSPTLPSNLNKLYDQLRAAATDPSYPANTTGLPPQSEGQWYERNLAVLNSSLSDQDRRILGIPSIHGNPTTSQGLPSVSLETSLRVLQPDASEPANSHSHGHDSSHHSHVRNHTSHQRYTIPSSTTEYGNGEGQWPLPPVVSCPCETVPSPPLVRPFPSNLFDTLAKSLPPFEAFLVPGGPLDFGATSSSSGSTPSVVSAVASTYPRRPPSSDSGRSGVESESSAPSSLNSPFKQYQQSPSWPSTPPSTVDLKSFGFGEVPEFFAPDLNFPPAPSSTNVGSDKGKGPSPFPFLLEGVPTSSPVPAGSSPPALLGSFEGIELPELEGPLAGLLGLWQPGVTVSLYETLGVEEQKAFLKQQEQWKPQGNGNKPEGPLLNTQDRDVVYCGKEEEMEVREIIHTFFHYGNHLLNLLQDYDRFMCNHFPTASPVLLAAICAFAAPLHQVIYPDVVLSKDYTAITNFLIDLPDPGAFAPATFKKRQSSPPIERVLALTIMSHIEYGQLKPARSKVYLQQAADLCRHWGLHEGKFDGLLGKLDVSELGTSSRVLSPKNVPYDEELAKRTWWEIYLTDVRLQFAVIIRDSGTVFKGLDPQTVKLDLPKSWMPESRDTPCPTQGFLVRSLSFLCSVPFGPPIPIDAPNRDQVLNSLDQTFANFLTVSEGAYRQASQTYKKTGSLQDKSNKEAAFQAFSLIAAGRVHLHHLYQLPEIHLNFDWCSLQPVDRSKVKSTTFPLPPESTLESPHLNGVSYLKTNSKEGITMGIARPTNRKRRRDDDDDEEDEDPADETGNEIVKISKSPMGSLTKIISTAQGSFNLVAFDSERENLPDPSLYRQRNVVDGGIVLPKPGQRFEPEKAEYVHNSFWGCSQVIAAFGILIGICSVAAALGRHLGSKRHRPDTQNDNNDNEPHPGRPALTASALAQIRAMSKELDRCEACLMREGLIWPIAKMKAGMLKRCRERVTRSLEAAGLQLRDDS